MQRAKNKQKEKTFRIFEAGAGIIPTGIIKKAAKSKAKGKNREFVGVDKYLSPNRISLLFSGKLRMPPNLTLKKADAVGELAQAKSRSQNLIFESYLLNNFDDKKREKFFSQASRILKPGGRLILVQDISALGWIKPVITRQKLSANVFNLSDKALKRSPSSSIHSRSTKAKRLRLVKGFLKRQGQAGKNSINTAIESGLIKTPDEYMRPILIVLRKPRKKAGKKKH